MNKIKKIKGTRKSKSFPDDIFVLPENKENTSFLAKTLAKQIDAEVFKKKYAPAADILKLVGLGAFLVASVAIPNLPIALKPFLVNENEREVWKRFNIPYLKRTLQRLEKQKLIETREENGVEIVILAERGKKRILKCSLDKLKINKPQFWDGLWHLVSYDVPDNWNHQRRYFRSFLIEWGFYPLHESVFLHAYPCEREIDFLKKYLGINEYVRIFKVVKIENDKPYREYFGV